MLGLLFQHRKNSMPSIQHKDYKGYAIVAMATPAGSGKYHSIFSVQSADQSEPTNQGSPMHQENITESPVFATEAEAVDAAHDRATAWIDTQAT
jgi:hypothetical protein